MIFGKIDYLNLLPFYLFLQKKVPKLSKFKKGVPSEINKKFHSRQVDIAFISSVTSSKSNCSNLGIIARKEVLSVLILKKKSKKDIASETSNQLAKILKQKGEVVIGDKALQIYFQNQENFTDLALKWNQKYHLPFVFAKLCFHKNSQIIRKISNKFRKSRIQIPLYILKRVSKKLNLSTSQIKIYLSKIDYFCDKKTKRGLNKFLFFPN